MGKRKHSTANVEPTRFTRAENGDKIPARGTRWRARWRTPEGATRSKTFDKKVDAERHLATVTTSKLVGGYIDPSGGRVTFRQFAEEWRARQVHRPSTATAVETYLRVHVYPALGDRPIARIRPSEVQSFVQDRAQVLAPATVAVMFRFVSAIFKSAVADRLIASSPCAGVKVPRVERTAVVPLTVEQIGALLEATPNRYRALVILAAGTGLRQGEALGLTVDRVDFLRRVVRVDRQLVSVRGEEPTFAPPKTAASNRVVPLPETVIDALAQHLAEYPPGSSGLIFTDDQGQAIRRVRFGELWRRVTTAAKLPAGVGNFHALRHFYASLLIAHGESVKVVQARLGHASASETLDVYGHLWPDSEDRTRTAVDLVLGSTSGLQDASGMRHEGAG